MTKVGAENTTGEKLLCLPTRPGVYVFGRNDCGQLGLGHTDSTPIPRTQTFFSGLKVRQVCCGALHTVIVAHNTSCDEVYAFGNNKYGQLGLGHFNNATDPQLIDGWKSQTKVIDVACGSFHSLMTTAATTKIGKKAYSKLWGFGRNDCGQLGLVSQKQLNISC